MVLGFGNPYILYQKLLWLHSCVHFLQHFQLFPILAKSGSQLFGVTAQTDSDIMIWHSINILPLKLLCLLLMYALLQQLSGICFLLARKGSENTLESQFRLTMVLGFGIPLYTLPEIIMPTSGVPLSNTFRYFCSWPGRSETTLESAVQIYSGIRIWHSFIYSTRSYFAYSLVCTLSNTFRYFYSKPGRHLKSLQMQPILRVILSFGFRYIVYNTLLHLLLVCTSPTHSGISKVGQEGISTPWNLSADLLWY